MFMRKFGYSFVWTFAVLRCEGKRVNISKSPKQAVLLMCPSTFFDVNYVINPWMDGNVNHASKAVAQEQWDKLHRELSKLATVKILTPQPGVPDMVFTANAGLVMGNKAVGSSFKCVERQGEEPFNAAWFEAAGLAFKQMPRALEFEGEGDALFAVGRPGLRRKLWAGFGFRTSLESHNWLRVEWGIEVGSLRLVDPRFYHLDTCFAPLPNGDVMYFPAAFDEDSRAMIEAAYPAARRVVVEEADALSFCCNVVGLGETLVLNRASVGLRRELEGRGFAVIECGLSEFMKAGGAAKCLVLHVA